MFEMLFFIHSFTLPASDQQMDERREETGRDRRRYGEKMRMSEARGTS